MAYCWKAKSFGLLYSIRKTNVETVTLKALSLPSERAYFENMPLLPPLSKKWADFWKLASVATSVQKVGLFWKHGSVAISVQKVGLINFADGLFL